MDKQVAVNAIADSVFPEASGADTAVPLTTADWLVPLPDRKILVIGDDDGCQSEEVDRVVHGIIQLDTQAGEQDKILNKAATTDFRGCCPDALPYESGEFDLVICSFCSTAVEIEKEILSEICRVIDSDGRLLIIDYLVPGNRLRGRKARQLRTAGEYINIWTRLRNSRHKRYLHQDAWAKRLADVQWDILQTATREAPHDFDTWADCYSPTEMNRIRLRAMLLQAPEKAQRFLTPVKSGDRIDFHMVEVFILAAASNKTG